MSTLQVTTITTVDANTPLILKTANTGGGQIVLNAANNDVQFVGPLRFTANVTGDGSGFTLPSSNVANAAFGVANAAFGKANTALQNTSGTFNGNLAVTGYLGVGVAANGPFAVDISGSIRSLYSSEGIQTTGDTIGRDFLAGKSSVATCIGYVGNNAMVQATNFGLSATPDLSIQPYGGNTRFLNAKTFFKATGNPGTGSKLYLAGDDSGDQWIGAGQNTAYWMEYSGNNNEGHVFRTGSTEKLIIAGSSSTAKVPANCISLNPNGGSVIAPYQPFMQGTAIPTTSLSAAGFANGYDISFSRNFTDAATNYNTTNGRFTAPVSGKYLICAYLLLSPSSSSGYDYRISINLNGTQHTNTSYSKSAGYLTLAINQVVKLTANDWVAIRFWNDAGSGTLHADDGYNRLSITLLS